MTTAKKTTTSSVRAGLAELAGVQQCSAPGCFRLLKEGQGKVTGQLKTCFTLSCVQYAEQIRQMEEVS